MLLFSSDTKTPLSYFSFKAVGEFEFLLIFSAAPPQKKKRHIIFRFSFGGDPAYQPPFSFVLCVKPFCFRKGDDGTASSVRASSNRLTGGRGSAGADNQERALVIRGDGSTPTRAGTRDPQSSFSLRQVYTLAPSERRGVEALIKSPNHPHCGMRRRPRSRTFSGRSSTSARLQLFGGRRVTAAESPRRRTCLRHPNPLFPPTTPANSSA